MQDKKVIILLATYNGLRFVSEQIESILCQTYRNWVLIIRDDNSIDGTAMLLKEFELRDSRIKVIDDLKGQRGSVENFSKLFSYAKREFKPSFLMFCDQDDIWHCEKLQVYMQKMQFLESNASNPYLIYGKMDLVDEQSKSLPGNFVIPNTLSFKKLIMQNTAYGCTMLLNGRLLDLIEDIPASAENHDYWIALVATSMGKTYCLEKKLVKYRQHSENLSGHITGSTFKNRYMRYKNVKVNCYVLSKKISMLFSFYKRYAGRLRKEDQEMLYSFLKSFETNKYVTIYVMLLNRIGRINFLPFIASILQVYLQWECVKRNLTSDEQCLDV